MVHILKYVTTKLIKYSSLFLFLTQLHAQSNIDYHQIAENIVRTALIEKQGYNWLKELCQIGPRLSGSEESFEAILWAKDKLKNIGCDSVWLQPVMVPHWIRGDYETAYISSSSKYENYILNIAALGGSIGTGENGITGKILEVKSFDELSEKSELAKNKIIFFNRPFDEGKVNTFASYGGAVDQRSEGAIQAAKYGGIAVIVRSVTSNYDNTPHVGSMRYVDSLKKIPAVSIGLLDADFLSNAIQEDLNLEITIQLNCETLPDIESFNVIGEIKGSVYPNEIIVIGGHFDSWDKGCGAHDDGAPCIQTMEVLHLIKKLNLSTKRTIRCVLFINEENGLRGGTTYSEYANNASEIHYAAIESDRGAFTPRGFSVTADSSVINYMQSWLPILEKASINWIKKGGSGADIYKIEQTKALIGYVPDDQRYFDFHHSDNDVLESVHPREMELGTAAISILTYLISELGLEMTAFSHE